MTPEIARVMRNWREDVVSAHELGTAGLPDEVQLALEAAEGRAVVTYNYGDFARLGTDWVTIGRDHAGVIVSYRQYTRNQIGVVTRMLLRLLNTIDAETLANSVQVLDHFRSDE